MKCQLEGIFSKMNIRFLLGLLLDGSLEDACVLVPKRLLSELESGQQLLVKRAENSAAEL
jgi:hypothetical protein